MPDILGMYAQSQPDKPGVIDDKPDGTVVIWTYAAIPPSVLLSAYLFDLDWTAVVALFVMLLVSGICGGASCWTANQYLPQCKEY